MPRGKPILAMEDEEVERVRLGLEPPTTRAHLQRVHWMRWGLVAAALAALTALVILGLLVLR